MQILTLRIALNVLSLKLHYFFLFTWMTSGCRRKKSEWREKDREVQLLCLIEREI